jgi:hypothetical protein
VASCDGPTHLETAACYGCAECVPSDGHRAAWRHPVTLRPVCIDLRVVGFANEHRRLANLERTPLRAILVTYRSGPSIKRVVELEAQGNGMLLSSSSDLPRQMDEVFAAREPMSNWWDGIVSATKPNVLASADRSGSPEKSRDDHIRGTAIPNVVAGLMRVPQGEWRWSRTLDKRDR